MVKGVGTVMHELKFLLAETGVTIQMQPHAASEVLLVYSRHSAHFLFLQFHPRIMLKHMSRRCQQFHVKSRTAANCSCPELGRVPGPMPIASVSVSICYMRSTSLARAYVRQKTQSLVNTLPLARAYREV